MISIYKWLLKQGKQKAKPGRMGWSMITSKPLFPKPATIHHFLPYKRGRFKSAYDYWRMVGTLDRRAYLAARGKSVSVGTKKR